MNPPSDQSQLSIAAESKTLGLSVDGLVGGNRVTLKTLDGLVKFDVPVALFPAINLTPGDEVVATLSLVKIVLAPIPASASPGLILPQDMH